MREVDTATVTEVEVHRGKLALLLLGALAFVAIGIWLVSGDFSDTRRSMWTPYAGWAAIVVFGGFAAAGAWRMVQRGAGLTLSPAGISAPGSTATVPWTAVTSISREGVGQQKFVRLDLDKAQTGKSKLRVGAQTLKISFDELMQLVIAYAGAHAGGSTSVGSEVSGA